MIVLDKIKELWLKNPDLRFFQLIERFKYLYKLNKNKEIDDFFYLEDTEIINFIDELYDNNNKN